MASPTTPHLRLQWSQALLAPALLFFAGLQVSAQEPGEIRGLVTRVTDGAPIAEALVTVVGTNRRVSTTADGRYVLRRIPAGRLVIRYQAVGYAPAQRAVELAGDAPVQLDVALEPAAVQLGEIVVEGASREAEKLLDAPSAVSVATPGDVRAAATVGVLPRAFGNMPGVDVMQADLDDIKVSARGFGAAIARTVLVLQDGRDVSMPFLGQQQWAALSIPPDDAERIEFIRGPGSALYGPNAFSGVINIITPEARDVVGTKLRVVGGGLSSRQGDLRHAGMLAGDRIGYRVNFGYSRSESWSRSRTRHDRQDWIDEYAPATDSALPASPRPDSLPLHGQTLDTATGDALGTPNDLVGMYGSVRLDWYAENGSVTTVDGGIGRVQNSLAVVGSGRIQALDDIRPWARLAWSTSHYHVQGSYSGRTTLEPQVVLGSGQRQEDVSGLYHGEAQYRTSLLDERLRIVTGLSLGLARVNTKGTLFLLANDNRSDWSYGGFAQADYALTPGLRVIGALRWDRGDLFDAEVTPRLGLLWRPGREQALRLTLNRSFLMPSHADRFLHIHVATQNLMGLEDSLRASSLGSALQEVPSGELFTNSAVVRTLVIANPDLDPQKVTSLELGYRGQVSRRIFATLDTYLNRKNDFVTGLLPATAVNPAYQAWTAPDAVPASEREAVEEAVGQALAGTPGQFGLTRLPDGSTAIVLSNGNAGLVYEWGVEVGLVGRLASRVTLSASYAYYGYHIRRQQQGDVLQPNTARHKGSASLAYDGHGGPDIQLTARAVEGYPVVSGVWRGFVPSSVTADASAGYRLSPNLGLQAVATNLFARRQFQIFGGSVEGRRILAGVTATF